MAKGIASGFPFAALGTRRELDDKWPTGSHGGTYGGNPMGCAAALATIEIMQRAGFLENVVARGAQLTPVSGNCRREHDVIAQVRGPRSDGRRPSSTTLPASPPIQKHCLDEGHMILMNAGTYGKCLRWMPPLVVNEREIDLGLAAFAAALKATAWQQCVESPERRIVAASVTAENVDCSHHRAGPGVSAAIIVAPICNRRPLSPIANRSYSAAVSSVLIFFRNDSATAGSMLCRWRSRCGNGIGDFRFRQGVGDRNRDIALDLQPFDRSRRSRGGLRN